MLIDSKLVELVTVIDPGTPQFVIGDSTRVTQVLMNLLSNAVKFTSEGAIEVAVWALTPNAGSVELQFSVKDTGIGVPREKVLAIFESFEQVDASATRNYGGTGLGLSISKHLCELMGGQIWVDSTPGIGSTFYFTVQCQLSE